MNFPKSIQQLCTPAYIYFLLSVIGIIMAIIQNVGNRRVYSLGSMSVPVPNTIMVFIVKIVAILFWTWILNLMCKDGHKEIAWFLVLLPFVLLFFMMGSVEGFTTKKMMMEAFENQPTSGLPSTAPPSCPSGFKPNSKFDKTKPPSTGNPACEPI